MNAERHALLRQALASRILVLDGGMGTMIQKHGLGPADFGGTEYEGCNEYLILTRPDVIASIHEAYLQVGADIIETATFGSTPLVLAEYGLEDRAYEISRAGAALVRSACDKYSTPEKPRFVAGSMGPTTKALSVTGGATFQELVDTFKVQAEGLIDGGADFLLLETQLDTLNAKAGLVAIEEIGRERGIRIPVALSCTIELQGFMLAGQDIESFYASIEHVDPIYVGLNCATGPDLMTDHVRSLAAVSRAAVACVPNAGLPNEHGGYDETPATLSAQVRKFAEAGWVNIVGGCCGTTPAHIAALAETVAGLGPRKPQTERRRWCSGIEVLELGEEGRPYLVGERTNSIGSRAFKNLINDGKFEEASEIARRQAKSGAHIIDVCLANPDRDERADMDQFLSKAARAVKLPFMVDSQEPAVVEAAFRLVQGKCVLNSVNLEEGVDSRRFKGLLALVRTYGAMVVAGCIDEKGMAVEPERKLEVAERTHRILTQDWGIAEEDIVFDSLVFPCGTGDANYTGSAAKTIEGVRLIAKRFPRCQSTLGISNVSFGLPPAGREVLNSVFLYHCVQAGLTTAIVNAEKIERYAAIPEDEKKLCDDLIFWRGEDPVAAFTAHFRGKKVEAKVAVAQLPARDRLPRNIIEGTKDGLHDALDELLAEGLEPLEIINGPLMDGMNEVGRLFNRNELIVAEVLQSAEAMKSAVAHLEPHMEKSDAQSRGTLLLATVKGDVHDIGKNLVEIIVGNNGYRIVNLGIKCPPEQIVAAALEHNPDLIGLSGLLVKSAQQMVIAAHDLREAGVRAPILVGGAALSNNFTVKNIAPEYAGAVVYAKDAMDGLDIANQLTGANREQFLARHAAMEERVRSGADSRISEAPEAAPKEKLVLVRDNPLFPAPTLDRVRWDRPLGEIWHYLNPQMLYGKHLGLKGPVEKLLEKRDAKAMELVEFVDNLKSRVLAGNWIEPRAVFRFFPVRTEGDAIQVYSPDRAARIASLRFPRQSEGWGLSLSDFCHPGEWDHIALFCCTAGIGMRPVAEKLKQDGELLASHALQALALESAEAYAELVHRHIRKIWGFPDAAELTVQDLFKAKYQGIRVSFGYPACPRLEDQETLFRLLEPQDIGIELTEGFMMDPEASVSALVFHHPQGRYFTISSTDLEAFEESLKGS